MKSTPTVANAGFWKCLILAGCLAESTALAQPTTDQVPRERTVPRQEQVKEMLKSRIRLGPIRLIPTFALSDAGYDSNVFGAPDNEISDWTAIVSAGARWVLPVGSKLYLRGEVSPQYIWYKDLTERRAFGGEYRASLVGFFNQMSVEATGYATKNFGILSSEIRTRVVQNVLDNSANVEVELSPALSLFAGAEVQRLRVAPGSRDPAGLVDVKRFDRTDGVARSGLRYRISPQINVSAVIEATRTELVVAPKERDNQGEAYLLGIHYNRPRIFLNLSAGYRTGRPYNDSTFPKYSTGTGSYFASYFLTPKLELQLYGGRGFLYGLSVNNPYFFETRNGLRSNVQVRPRLLLSGYAEYSTSEYPFLLVENEVKRLDKGITLGGGFSVQLFRKAVFSALAYRSNYTSNVPDVGGSVFGFTTRVSFEGELSR